MEAEILQCYTVRLRLRPDVLCQTLNAKLQALQAQTLADIIQI